MAQPNFQFEKRQKELAKKRKKEEKKQRKLEEGKQTTENPDPATDEDVSNGSPAT